MSSKYSEMIIIPDTLRRPAEVERDELRVKLAEAQTEIERLKQENELLKNMHNSTITNSTINIRRG